jgi:hypothetical protein
MLDMNGVPSWPPYEELSRDLQQKVRGRRWIYDMPTWSFDLTTEPVTWLVAFWDAEEDLPFFQVVPENEVIHEPVS